jgi:hypothetical protein
MFPLGFNRSLDANHAAQRPCAVPVIADVGTLAAASRTLCTQAPFPALGMGLNADSVTTLGPDDGLGRASVLAMCAQDVTPGANDSSLPSHVGAVTMYASSVARDNRSVASEPCTVSCHSSSIARYIRCLSIQATSLSAQSSSLSASSSIPGAQACLLSSYISSITGGNEVSPRKSPCFSRDRVVSAGDREGSPGETCGSSPKNELSPCDRGVVARDRSFLPPDRPRSVRTSGVLCVDVHGYGVVVDDHRASNQSFHVDNTSLQVIVDGDGEIVLPFYPTQVADRANVRSRAVVRRIRRALRIDRGVDVWDRCVRRFNRGRFRRAELLSAQRGTSNQRAAVWLAHAGPQTGQDRTQACASKHPDGCIEALFQHARRLALAAERVTIGASQGDGIPPLTAARLMMPG